MKSECEKIIGLILEAQPHQLPAEAAEHLAHCSECRHLAADWTAVRAALGETAVPELLDKNVRAAAHDYSRRLARFRRIVVKSLYFTAAAACVMLASGVFFFTDYRPNDYRRSNNAMLPGAAWHSGLDRRLFELGTEIEMSREMLNLAPVDRRQDVIDILLPPPPAAEVVDIDDDQIS